MALRALGACPAPGFRLLRGGVLGQARLHKKGARGQSRLCVTALTGFKEKILKCSTAKDYHQRSQITWHVLPERLQSRLRPTAQLPAPRGPHFGGAELAAVRGFHQIHMMT